MKLPPGHVAGQGVAKPKCTGGFGERMLRTMGWDDGKGLGKEGNGIKEAIQVKKKEDTVGVGGNGSYAWGDKWWEKAFDSAVATVGESDSSDSSDSDSDDEHMAAMVAAVNRDGTRTTASADELKLLASLSKGGRLAAGRFGGRDAKMARIRQQEAKEAAEAAAKLGFPSTAGTAGGTTAGATGASDKSDTTSEVKLSAGAQKRKAAAGSEASSGGKEGKRGRKAKAGAAEEEEQQPAKKQRIVIEPVMKQEGPAFDFKPTPSTGWWGEKRFQSAGCLEGMDQTAAEAAKRRMTFDEDDQARIYNAAQAKKTQGKVGLGQGTGTVKVGGVKWEGKKVTFDDPEGGAEAEAEAGEAGGEGASGGGRLMAIGSSTHLAALAGSADAEGRQQEEEGKRRGKSKGKKAAAAAAAAAAEEAAAEAAGGKEEEAGPPSGWEASVKWKKIITQQLAAAEQQQLKLKELQRLVVAAVLAKHAGVVSSKTAIRAALASRLEGSSKFVVEGKLVRLRS